MTTDRDLLLAFVEWQHKWDTNRRSPVTKYEEVCLDAFLARRESLQNMQQLDSPAAAVSTDGESLRMADAAAVASILAPAPHVKVTEVEGRAEWEGEDFCIIGPHIDGHYLCTMVPDEAMQRRLPNGSIETGADGPRGRWRVTCEFWPEAKP